MKKEKGKYPREVIEAVLVILPFIEPGICLPAELVLAAQSIKKIPAKTLQDIWNDNANREYLNPCGLLTPQRRRICNARLKEVPDLKKWKAFIEMINKSEWCLGTKPSLKFPNWKANFDWFIRPGTIIKFIEGGFCRENEFKPESKREEYGSELDRRSEYRGIK